MIKTYLLDFVQILFSLKEQVYVIIKISLQLNKKTFMEKLQFQIIEYFL